MRIGTKLTLYLVVTLLVVMTVHALVNIWESNRALRGEMAGEAGRLANLIAEEIRRSGLRPDPPHAGLPHLVESIGKLEGVRRIVVYGPGGEVVLSSGEGDLPPGWARELVGAARREGRPQAGEGRLGEEEVLVRVSPLPSASGKSGALVAVAMDLRGVEHHSSIAQRRNVLTIAAITFFLAVLFYLFVRQNVGHPLEELTERVARFGGEGEGGSAAAGGRDEIARLSLEFDAMEGRVERAHRQLAGEREYVRNLLESIHCGIAAVDPEGRVTSWNRPMGRMVGVRREEAVGKPLSAALPAPLAGELAGMVGGLLRGQGEGSPAREVEADLPGLGRRRLRVSGRPLHPPEGGEGGAMLVVEDITAAARLADQVRRTEKLAAVGQLASGLAHEIGTPLNVISARAEFIQDHLPAESPLRPKLASIVAQIDRIANLVRRLLDFARQRPIAPHAVDLRAVSRTVIELLEAETARGKVRVREELPGDLPAVEGDPEQLQQLFLNLFLNAVHAMPAGGTLRLRAWPAPLAPGEGDGREGAPGVAFEVSDSGVGMTEEEQRRIFEPFYTTKGAGEGTGLGLAVCHRIVEEHGGRIEVRSAAGQGSAFTVHLPLRPPSPGRARHG